MIGGRGRGYKGWRDELCGGKGYLDGEDVVSESLALSRMIK